MIDIKSGNILLNGNSFIIKKGLKKDEFIKSNLIGDVLSQQASIYTYYFLKPQLIGSESFTVVLYFNQNDLIEFMNISLSNNGNMLSWDNWSEKEELKKKDEHDKWLERNIGKPPYKYLWGEISSNYDPRSGSSMITIRYNA
jgi:hypothetical protein